MTQQNSIRDLDFSCGGLLPPIGPLEGQPAARDDRRDVWLTREELRTASLGLAENIASERKRLVFLFSGNTCETLIGLLAAVAAGHAVAVIDPSLAEDKLRALIEAYQPEVVLKPEIGETLNEQAGASGVWRSYQSRAGVVEWTATDARTPLADINPALQVLLSTSGTTGSQ
ncbi:MAG TPA: AMP-binding protein [Roseiarcus sp.]